MKYVNFCDYCIKVLKKIIKFVKIKFVTNWLYGEYGEGVNTADCGSVMLGFESLYSPHLKNTVLGLFFCAIMIMVII